MEIIFISFAMFTMILNPFLSYIQIHDRRTRTSIQHGFLPQTSHYFLTSTLQEWTKGGGFTITTTQLEDILQHIKWLTIPLFKMGYEKNNNDFSITM